MGPIYCSREMRERNGETVPERRKKKLLFIFTHLFKIFLDLRGSSLTKGGSLREASQVTVMCMGTVLREFEPCHP